MASSVIQGARQGRSNRARYGSVLLLVALFAGAFLVMGGTRSLGVWFGAIALGLCMALVGIGVYITFRILDFPDLTLDGTFPLGAAVAAVMLDAGASPWSTLPVAMLLGALCGAFTAIIATKLKIHSLLASIIVATGLVSVNLRVMGRSNIPLLNTDTIFTPFTVPFQSLIIRLFGDDSARYANNILAILLVGLIVALCKIALDRFNHSELGLAMRATGDNQQMVRALGRDTDQFLILGVAISNALVGLSGAIMAQYQGFADVSMGLGLIIAGLAAVILGETLLRPATLAAATLAAVIGMVLYRVAIAAALSTKIPLPGGEFFRIEATDVKLATALLVLVTLWLTHLRKQKGR